MPSTVHAAMTHLALEVAATCLFGADLAAHAAAVSRRGRPAPALLQVAALQAPRRPLIRPDPVSPEDLAGGPAAAPDRPPHDRGPPGGGDPARRPARDAPARPRRRRRGRDDGPPAPRRGDDAAPRRPRDDREHPGLGLVPPLPAPRGRVPAPRRGHPCSGAARPRSTTSPAQVCRGDHRRGPPPLPPASAIGPRGGLADESAATRCRAGRRPDEPVGAPPRPAVLRRPQAYRPERSADGLAGSRRGTPISRSAAGRGSASATRSR